MILEHITNLLFVLYDLFVNSSVPVFGARGDCEGGKRGDGNGGEGRSGGNKGDGSGGGD